MEPVPCVFLTGFLGAGKTTLLNRVLRAPRERWRVAVIQNEYVCEFGVENELTDRRSTAFEPHTPDTDLSQVMEEVVEMGGACLCCSASGQLRRTLTTLVQRRRQRLEADPSALVFSHVIIEATGRAFAGPIAAVLQEQDGLRLSQVVCVVDASTADRRLLLPDGALPHPSELGEAVEQVANADLVVLNKLDLCPGGSAGSQVRSLQAMVRRINSRCETVLSTRCDTVPLDRVLSADARAGERPPPMTTPPAHDAGIQGASLSHSPAIPRAAFDAWLGDVLAAHGADLLRLKGVVNIEGAERRLIVQCVGMQREVVDGRPWAGDARETVVALIGRGADAIAEKMRKSLPQ